MKKQFEEAKLELIIISDDIITASGDTGAGEGSDTGDGPGL